jgi:D-sedoheptulose 7-phosphate isomerase
MQFARDYLTRLKSLLDRIPLEKVEAIRGLFAAARANDRMIFIVGNGGSAATSSHFAVDLGKGASVNKPRRFRVLSLTDNLPWITALANDFAYDQVFEQQLRNYARPGDILLAVSASGNSPNIVNAARAAKELGCTVIGWSGFGGGKLAGLADVSIVAEDNHYGRVEDVHSILMHLICYSFMEAEA